jgi:dienelactone hydrolase
MFAGLLANMALGTQKKLLKAKRTLAPILCVHGINDQFASVEQVKSFLKAFEENKGDSFKLSLEVLPADHFFCDRQINVAKIVYDWVSNI